MGFLLFVVVAVIVAVIGSTRAGRVVGVATENFLLFYAGVFALIALTAAVGIGLVATDRIIMSPSSRVTAQAVHRAVSFGAVSFLAIHIAFEIAAGRSHPADVVVPFLDQGRTFYLGLGTVASDLFVVIAVSGIMRARLAASVSPRTWRAIHCLAYVAWLMGIVHGLLAGRAAKTFFGYSGFVAWSYGACVVAVAIALMVRFVAKDRSGQMEAQPVPERPPPPWQPPAGMAAAPGLPALAQSAFGPPHLPVTPGRPYQRALPAPPPAATSADLAVGRAQVVDHGHFDHDEARGHFGHDDAPEHFGYDDPREHFGYADPRGHFGQDDTRGHFGQDDTGGHFGQDAAPAFEDEFSANETTGPLPSVPSSRYGTRS